MKTIHSGRMGRDGLLRLALRLDAVASGALGLACAATAPALDDVLGIPTGWLLALGAFLVAYAGGLGWLAARPRIPVGLAWAVVVGNLVWVLDSAVTLAAGWFPLTTAGTAIVVAQAVAVVAFAELQFVGLRRARVAT